MTQENDETAAIPAEYAGRILTGDFSAGLRDRVADCIDRMRRYDAVGGPAIPYMAAWREADRVIWYEYAGSRFTAQLGCPLEDLADEFRRRIIDRRIYRRPEAAPDEHAEVLDDAALRRARPHLRAISASQGEVDAVYKLETADGGTMWFKDLARVERFPADRTCISLGQLTPLTKEMAAEEKCGRLIEHLRDALARVKTLSGLLPICASCKKIRDDQGYWNRIEEYITAHSEAVFSHSVCPRCARKLYPDLYGQDDAQSDLGDDIADIDVFLKNS